MIPGCPTLAVRRHGEAWNRPFVSVIWPYYETEGDPLNRITSLESTDSDLVALAITPDRDNDQYEIPYGRYTVLNATDPTKAHKVAGDIGFRGIYGVTGEGRGRSLLYLGRGYALRSGRYGLESANGELMTASLVVEDGRLTVSCDADALLYAPPVAGKRIELRARGSDTWQAAQVVDRTSDAVCYRIPEGIDTAVRNK